jgi:hypothetical protein
MTSENPSRPREEGIGTGTGRGAGSATACRHDSQRDHVHHRAEEHPTGQGRTEHRRQEELRTRSGWAGASAAQLPGGWRRSGPSSGLRSQSCQWECPEQPERQRAGPSQQPGCHSAEAGQHRAGPEPPPEGTHTAVPVYLQAGQAAGRSAGTAYWPVLDTAPGPAASRHYWAGRQVCRTWVQWPEPEPELPGWDYSEQKRHSAAQCSQVCPR